MLETIYIVRHGYRLNWVSNTWRSATDLPRDPPLAAFGEAQALETAQYFLSLPEDLRPTVILSSPYYRCLQTTKPISEALGVPIYVEHGLSEWYSPVAPGTGLHPRPGSATSLKSFFPEVIDDSWTPMWYPSRRGENVPAAHVRAEGVVRVLDQELARRYPGAHKRVLLVTHAATAIALVRALVGNRTLPLRVGCCSLTELQRKEGAAGKDMVGGWVPKKLVDGSHLTGGTSRDWGFEDIQIACGEVVDDPGEPGTEKDEDGPVGSQVQLTSNL